jgi:hypothetical protein
MGWDWPFAPYWFGLVVILFLSVLFFHGNAILKATLPRFAWRLIFLRFLAGTLFLLLLARPFITTDEPNPKEFKLVTLTDLSGSMNTKDNLAGSRRIELVRPFLDSVNQDSWINRMNENYGKVENLGFSDQTQRMVGESWRETELGQKTALGDALAANLGNEKENKSLGAVVVFSDGKNNLGVPILEVAKDYRSRGVPVNVVGVGREQAVGDISVQFLDRKPKAVAKEELLLTGEVENKFDESIQSKVSLMLGKKILEEIPISLAAGEKRKISFSPLLPKTAGPRRYRLLVNPPMGDADPSNNSDSLLIVVKAPDKFTTLYLSNRIHPLFPFVKRVLVDEERFDFNALIRMSPKVFHAFGENVKPAYPEDASFWMDYDAVLLDTNVLGDLNQTLVDSLKDFVQKKGGGLLLFGELEGARIKLGGLVPAKKVERVLAKENLSLVTLEEPLFGPTDEVEKMKPFLPKRLPGFFIVEQNPAARGVVLSRSNKKPVLSVQAYGAGKVGYWGSQNDWRRSMLNTDGAKEFRHFWQALVQWLGTGGEDRLKTQDSQKTFLRGTDAPLQVEALGADFEPSIDAMVEAHVAGPDDFNKVIQLYPEGSVAGRYAGSFRPALAGAYEVKYILRFPDGETLERQNFLRVSESGEEAVDVSFARVELQMLAKLTGGTYLPIDNMNIDWEPTFAKDLPSVRKRHSLANAWLIFVLLFFLAGAEWIIRRQAGLR